MKELSIEKMEEVQGGGYCDIINYWMNNNYDGYQGSISALWYAWGNYCA